MTESFVVSSALIFVMIENKQVLQIYKLGTCLVGGNRKEVNTKCFDSIVWLEENPFHWIAPLS